MLRYTSYLLQGTAEKKWILGAKRARSIGSCFGSCAWVSLCVHSLFLCGCGWGSDPCTAFHSSSGQSELLRGDWPSVSPRDTTNQTWGRTGLKLFLLSQDHTLLEVALSQHRSVSCCSNSAMNESLSFESYTFVSNLWCLGLLLCWGLSLQKNRAWKNEPFSAAMKLSFKSVSLFIYIYIWIGFTEAKLCKLL